MFTTIRGPIARRAVIAITGLLAAFLAALSLADAASAAPTGFVQIRPAHVNGMCLDVAHVSTWHGANVIQGTCVNGWNQQWRLERNGTSKFFFVRPRHSNSCLDVIYADLAHGADVIQGNCWGGANQQWKFVQEGDVTNRTAIEPFTGGRFRIVAKHSGKCLDVAHMSSAHGANVIQGDCWNPGWNQRWVLRPTS